MNNVKLNTYKILLLRYNSLKGNLYALGKKEIRKEILVMEMESLDYLERQFHRMNATQISLVERVRAQGSANKGEEERLAQMYLWLHIDIGHIRKRRFTSSIGLNGRYRKYPK